MRFAKVDWKMKDLWLLLPLLTMLASRSAWAQVDLNGEWSPRIYNDNRDIGDYTGIPLNEVGLLRAESWTPDQDALPENGRCYWPADLGLRVAPSQLYIYQELDSATQQIVAYHLHTAWLDQTIWMDGRPHPPDYALRTYQGFSTGKWQDKDTLVYTTDHFKEGFLTRTGAIRSSKAAVTSLINRYGNILTITMIIDDPVYLTEPYIRESSWVYAPNQVTATQHCEIPAEGTLLPAGSVPSFLPGQNDSLSDFAIEYGLPLESALGGAETTYPEYIKKMKTMKRAPRTTTTHYRRFG
ncbi:MAG: hypothetical protein DMG31_08120 [Acidobacteria bacterium]|nr:MAG: hypothetical protein DMG31_08120 [Acidobacteriota bacterium]